MNSKKWHVTYKKEKESAASLLLHNIQIQNEINESKQNANKRKINGKKEIKNHRRDD